MYGWLTFYHQGYEVAKEFQPYMTDLQVRLQKVRRQRHFFSFLFFFVFFKHLFQGFNRVGLVVQGNMLFDILFESICNVLNSFGSFSHL